MIKKTFLLPLQPELPMPFDILPDLFLRAPLYSYTAYLPGTARFLDDPSFRLAIYLASRSFFELLANKDFDVSRLNAKELLTLQKYYNRMCFRPTPFGVFSSFTITHWGPGPGIVLAGESDTIVHTLPDQQTALELGRILKGAGLAESYLLNPSLYRFDDHFRFIRTVKPEKGTLNRYILESLDAGGLVISLLAHLKEAPRDRENIISFLRDKTGCVDADAVEYIQFLHRTQVIFPEHLPNITGRDYLSRLGAEVAWSGGINDATARVDVVAGRLASLLEKSGRPQPQAYFYAAAERKALSGSVNHNIQSRLSAGSDALSRLCLPSSVDFMTRFAADFSARFEERKVPLLLALDPDGGVTYGDLAADHRDNSLLKQVRFPPPAPNDVAITWTPAHRLLMEKWRLAGAGQPLKLVQVELSSLKGCATERLPPGIAVMFRETAEGLLIETAGGVSAASLIARFTAFSEEVAQLACKIARQEISANPGVVFTEIAQLSDGYVDNVNRRLNLYDYETPVNCTSLLPSASQIGLGDLLVSVRGGEIILESARLGKRVIPRLSSAYNFRHNQLAVFRFLCDLQYQSLQPDFSFDLERYFPGLEAYPRVEYEGVILSPAKWHIAQGPPTGTDGLTYIRLLRERLKLPKQVALARFDQQLIFHLDDPVQAQLCFDCTIGKEGFTLTEYFPPCPSTVMDANGRPFAGQFIAFLVKGEMSYPALPFVPPIKAGPARDFGPGSPWTYLKIYCTPSAADQLIARRLGPLAIKFAGQTGAKWFFIRYTQGGHHIRFRIRAGENNAGRVIALLEPILRKALKNGLISNYQADTYKREIERYGADMIGFAEDFFQASSEWMVRLAGVRLKNPETDIWPAALSSVAVLVEQALPVVEQQLEFLARHRDAFLEEFKGGKHLKLELDQVYRENREIYYTSLEHHKLYQSLGMARAWNLFRRQAAVFSEKATGLSAQRRERLLADMVHMHCNRLFTTGQRRQELAIYYFLHKLKRSVLSYPGTGN